MRALRLSFWLAMFVAVAAGAFALHFLPAQRDLAEARRAFETARRDLEAAGHEVRDLEARVQGLRTNVDAVELGARTEYRLIRPGERLELVQVGGRPGSRRP
jgi:cell division protein FtsB